MLKSLVYLQQGNVKESDQLLEIVNIEEENHQIFCMTLEISMKLS